jgi:hypothetical protein
MEVGYVGGFVVCLEVLVFVWFWYGILCGCYWWGLLGLWVVFLFLFVGVGFFCGGLRFLVLVCGLGGMVVCWVVVGLFVWFLVVFCVWVVFVGCVCFVSVGCNDLYGFVLVFLVLVEFLVVLLVMVWCVLFWW